MENKAGTTEHFSKRGAGWLTSNCTLPPRLHRPWKKLRWKRLCSVFCVYSRSIRSIECTICSKMVLFELVFQPERNVMTYSPFRNNSLHTGSPDVVCRYSLTWTKEVDRCWSRRYSTEVPVWCKLLPSSLTIRGPVELFSPQTRAWPVCSGQQKYHNMFSFFLEIDCLYKWKEYGSFQFARNNPIILRLK